MKIVFLKINLKKKIDLVVNLFRLLCQVHVYGVGQNVNYRNYDMDN